MAKKKLVELAPEELENRLKERTLVLCKPESIVLGIYPYILEGIQRMHYKTPLIKLFRFTRDSVLDFYASVIDIWEPRDKLIQIFLKMTEDPTLAVGVEGPNSISAIRKLAGGVPSYTVQEKELILSGYEAQFQPLNAPMGTIRGDFSAADIAVPDTQLIPVPNYIHASSDKKEYEREINVLLKHKHILKEDFIEYRRPEWKVLYGRDI